MKKCMLNKYVHGNMIILIAFCWRTSWGRLFAHAGDWGSKGSETYELRLIRRKRKQQMIQKIEILRNGRSFVAFLKRVAQWEPKLPQKELSVAEHERRAVSVQSTWNKDASGPHHANFPAATTRGLGRPKERLLRRNSPDRFDMTWKGTLAGTIVLCSAYTIPLRPCLNCFR